VCAAAAMRLTIVAAAARRWAARPRQIDGGRAPDARRRLLHALDVAAAGAGPEQRQPLHQLLLAAVAAMPQAWRPITREEAATYRLGGSCQRVHLTPITTITIAPIAAISAMA
jgi:hypothetical protein